MVIQLYNCVIQYNGNLKTERYDWVQVVLLQSLIWIYQGSYLEGVQKCGGRDISEGSLVSCRPKDDMAGDEPLPDQFGTNFVNFGLTNLKSYKEKRPSVIRDRWLHSREGFTATKGPKPNVSYKKVL